MATTRQHKIVIIGGGTAGISVAARLRNAGEKDVAVIEPATTHYYQPLWTLVGGGCAPAGESARPESSVMPKGATWIRSRAEGVDPDQRRVGLEDGTQVGYEFLVVSVPLHPATVASPTTAATATIARPRRVVMPPFDDPSPPPVPAFPENPRGSSQHAGACRDEPRVVRWGRRWASRRGGWPRRR